MLIRTPRRKSSAEVQDTLISQERALAWDLLRDTMKTSNQAMNYNRKTGFHVTIQYMPPHPVAIPQRKPWRFTVQNRACRQSMPTT